VPGGSALLSRLSLGKPVRSPCASAGVSGHRNSHGPHDAYNKAFTLQRGDGVSSSSFPPIPGAFGFICNAGREVFPPFQPGELLHLLPGCGVPDLQHSRCRPDTGWTFYAWRLTTSTSSVILGDPPVFILGNISGGSSTARTNFCHDKLHDACLVLASTAASVRLQVRRQRGAGSGHAILVCCSLLTLEQCVQLSAASSTGAATRLLFRHFITGFSHLRRGRIMILPGMAVIDDDRHFSRRAIFSYVRGIRQ